MPGRKNKGCQLRAIIAVRFAKLERRSEGTGIWMGSTADPIQLTRRAESPCQRKTNRHV